MSLKNNSKYRDIQSYWRVFNVMIIPFMFIYFVDEGQTIKDESIVKYVNTKYLEHIEIKMFRRRNSDPYKTNITTTFLQAWGPNNVTILFSYPIQGGKMFNMSVVGCHSIDKLWMVQLLRQNTNVTECPVPPGTYRYFNLGAIPRVFPSPAPSVPRGSSNIARVEIFKTSTKERMVDILLHVHVKK